MEKIDQILDSLYDRVIEPIEAKEQLLDLFAAIKWVAFDFYKIETRPPKYGKYLITRKDGKIHWETWNSSGWAYNHNEIRYWAEIKPPCYSQYIMEIDKNKWDKLIEEHYLSCLKRRPNDYELKHSREEMRDWWYSKLERNREDDIENFIIGSTHANNNGYNYHPV